MLDIPPYVPPAWLANGHLQTVMVPYFAVDPGPRGTLVSISIEGGALRGRLHVAGPGARACVLVLHGIAGTASEPFVMRTAHEAVRHGIDALRLDLRGTGESSAPGPAGLWHAGLTADVRAAIAWLATRYSRVHVVGFSLGGQLALRTAGEWGSDAPRELASVTAISPPVDLAASARFAEEPLARLYILYFLRTLRARYAAARALMGPRFEPGVLRGVTTIRGYDAAVVAPFFGYRDVDDYYARASSLPVLDAISVPTLIVHAHDDPVVPSAPLVQYAKRARKNVRVVLTDHGGHVAFLAARAAPGDRTRFWAEHRAIDLVRAVG